MGCCGSTDERNQRVGNELENAKQQFLKIHKLLLLGAGNSGKSTFMKQLTSIHDTEKIEDRTKVEGIQQGIIHQMSNLIAIFEDDVEPDDLSSNMKGAMEVIKHANVDGKLDASIAGAIETIWADQRVKQVFANKTTLSLVDSCPYFFDDVHRFAAPDYKPTEKDYLLVRIKTTGFSSTQFEFDNNHFEVFDVGGQRSERSKWIHCFSSVEAILFVASLSCFDQMLHEDESINALEESLELFNNVINNHYFRNTGFILFLNKSDLFRDKITNDTVPKLEPSDKYPPNQLGYWYPNEWQDRPMYDFDVGVEFIKNQYLAQNDSPAEKPVFDHLTCATEKDQVAKLFVDVQNFVVMRALKRHGIL